MYEAVWPRGKQVTRSGRFARRLDTLEGKTIGEIWDGVFRGDQIFPMLRNELRKRYPSLKVVTYDVFGRTHGGDEARVLSALPGKLKQTGCDAVISGLGC